MHKDVEKEKYEKTLFIESLGWVKLDNKFFRKLLWSYSGDRYQNQDQL
jgi:hypothetical protein